MSNMIVNNGYGASTNAQTPLPGKYVSWPDAKLRATPPPPPQPPQLSLARPYVPKGRPSGQLGTGAFDGSVKANIHPPRPTATLA